MGEPRTVTDKATAGQSCTKYSSGNGDAVRLPKLHIFRSRSPSLMLSEENAERAVITLIAAGPNPKTVGREGGETLDVTAVCSNCKTRKELQKQNSDM